MANLELWETLKESIKVYTGLSPTIFFTVVAVALAFYYVVSGLFGSPPPHQTRGRDFDEEMEPLPPPVQLGEIGEEELKVYDGSDPKKPLLMAIKAQIYDVSQSRMFYGPGGPYALFAGKDASRALAKMSFEKEDLTGDIAGLGPFELDALQDWEYKFMSKYVKVGTIKKADVDAPPPSDTSAATDVDVTKTAEDESSAIAATEPVEEHPKEVSVSSNVDKEE
ncbi:hypothetical protein GIB67_009617 [Kingdonia uniflora]|uniref:Cytochrome b5 heme-binding domain-containing protein n=1 Tax=Kingdonia uniflora TaxID=39325 RepID=A0A7J7M2H4_9MAGN|nr:hypothetical protein GIB67_009617 [Kingdonia uniflora]